MSASTAQQTVADGATPELVPTGPFHRLGIAVRGEPDEIVGWFERVMGAVELGDEAPAEGRRGGTHDGETAVMLWLGDLPLGLFVVTGPGMLSHYLDRNGPGLHSVAWSVEDNWFAEATLRERGIRITGTSIPGRHFYLHPRDTHGMLVELTDTHLHGDPREGATLRTRTSAPLVDVRRLERVVAVVRDLRAAVTFYGEVFGAREVLAGLTPEGDEFADVRVQDVTLRLVQPLGGEGRYGSFLAARGERMYGYTVAVPDLEAAARALEGDGIGIESRTDDGFWTDPAGTLDMPVEWVQV